MIVWKGRFEKQPLLPQFFKAESRLRYPGSLGYSLFFGKGLGEGQAPDPHLSPEYNILPGHAAKTP